MSSGKNKRAPAIRAPDPRVEAVCTGTLGDRVDRRPCQGPRGVCDTLDELGVKCVEGMCGRGLGRDGPLQH